MTTTALPSVFTLARLADCADPTSTSSPGGRWLLGIAEHIAERRDDHDEDTAHEVADSAIPPYSHDLWAVFVDLGAWREDTAELGDEGGDLTRSATLALFGIAERLAAALLAEDA